ncbi:MAG: glucose-6-phosphate isomerase [Beijerinckiaceae bacterium]
MNARVAQSIDNVRAKAIGVGGLSEAAIATAFADVASAVEKLRLQLRDGSLALLTLPDETSDLATIRSLADIIVADAKDVVFLGTGGSALGAQTLAQLADHGVPGLAQRAGLRAHFMDNLDPLTFAEVIESLPMKTTRFVAISKSGGTGETLMQTSVALAALEKAGLEKRIASHVFAITEPERSGKPNALRELLQPYGVATLDHHTGIGGRYSVLTNVGLLPAAILGLKIANVRKGAKLALSLLARSDPSKVPAVAGAAINLAAMRQGKNIAVMMGYGDRFERFTRWWVQLWAESLGKKGQGSQPVAALGPVDQHSQQQLYLAGPRDKLFTVLTLDVKGKGPVIPKALAKRCGEPDFGGRRIGDLVAAQGRAMIDTFAKNGRPVRHIHIDKLDEESLGELLMQLMIETILTGYAMGIDPFDQPAVEEAKILAKKYLAQD